MNKFIPTAAALVLALGLPQVAEAQNPGQGQGKGNGSERAQPRGGDEARGRGAERAARDDRPNRPDVREMARGADPRGRDQGRDDRPGRIDRDLDDAVRAVFRAEPDRGLIAGCPPGLAKRDNGCLPPGQEQDRPRPLCRPVGP